jgi:hypothetical protein
VLGGKGVDDQLAMVIRTEKKKPGKTENENDDVEDEKRGESRLFTIFANSIKPEDLRKDNKRNGAVTRVK